MNTTASASVYGVAFYSLVSQTYEYGSPNEQAYVAKN